MLKDPAIEAAEALKNSDVIIGYTVCGFGKGPFSGKEFLTMPMKKEVERCVMAFEEAVKGKTVAMILQRSRRRLWNGRADV